MTQRELADKTGISVRSISRFENDARAEETKIVEDFVANFIYE